MIHPLKPYKVRWGRMTTGFATEQEALTHARRMVDQQQATTAEVFTEQWIPAPPVSSKVPTVVLHIIQ